MVGEVAHVWVWATGLAGDEEPPQAIAEMTVMQTMETRSVVKILRVKCFILKQYPFRPPLVNPFSTFVIPGLQAPGIQIKLSGGVLPFEKGGPKGDFQNPHFLFPKAEIRMLSVDGFIIVWVKSIVELQSL